MTEQPKCKDLVRAHYGSRIADLRRLIAADNAGDEDGVPDLGTLNEYGLSFDYVAPGTFTDQRRGYWRYQLSWGGPSDEFRFYAHRDADHTPWRTDYFKVERIEYWYLDWWDGAHRTMRKGKDFDLLAGWFANLAECEVVQHVYDAAMRGEG
jgi:hypothetical protein